MSYQAALARSVRARLQFAAVAARRAQREIPPRSQRHFHQWSVQAEQRARVPSIRWFSSATANIVPVPSMGDSISEGTVVEWLKAPGDRVEVDDVVVVLETDKVSVDVRAPFAGVLEAQLAKIDESVLVGVPLFSVTQASGSEAAVVAPPAPSKQAEPVVQESPVLAISKEPATPVSSEPKTTTVAASPAPIETTTANPVPLAEATNRKETRVQMSVLKIRAAQRQKDTQNTAAMLSTFQECDLGNLIALRDELGPEFEKTHGIKLGFMSTFLKASALALEKVPAVNSFIDMEAKDIVYNEFVDINVAVASGKGVVVPVIRNVEKMSVADIEKTLASFSEQARAGTLAVEDLAGGTFTVSNGAVSGSLLSTSMLTAPQSAVLGVHGVKMRPAVLNGQVVPRPMMFLSLTYDHRVIDGREGVTFLKSIADSVADPRRLLVNL